MHAPRPPPTQHTRARMRDGSLVDEAALLEGSRCALDVLNNKFNHYKSLNREDYLLLPTLIGAAHGRPGVFVEMGAYTGEMSNTAILERCFNWTGLLIEGNPTNYGRLVRGASTGYGKRPRSQKLHSAVCEADRLNGNRTGTVRFTIAGGPVAGDLSKLSDEHQKAWGKVNKPDKVVDVPCMPLDRIMQEHGFGGGATYLSLDVEGAEAMVLSTIRPSTFKVMMVEMDSSNTGKDERVQQLIVADGFRKTLDKCTSAGGGTTTCVIDSEVYTRSHPHVRWQPLPPRFIRPGRLGRPGVATNVTATVLAQMLVRAARGESVY